MKIISLLFLVIIFLTPACITKRGVSVNATNVGTVIPPSEPVRGPNGIHQLKPVSPKQKVEQKPTPKEIKVPQNKEIKPEEIKVPKESNPIPSPVCPPEVTTNNPKPLEPIKINLEPQIEIVNHEMETQKGQIPITTGNFRTDWTEVLLFYLSYLMILGVLYMIYLISKEVFNHLKLKKVPVEKKDDQKVDN